MGADSVGASGNRRPVAFISHHSSQVETARQLKKVLAINGVDGWMAPDDIDPGRPFDQAIIEQVRRSDLIILLFCSRSDQSRHVKRELMMAENGDKLIFPVRLENIDAEGLAYWLNDYQWIDWFDRRDDTIQRMIDTIKRLVRFGVADEQAAPAIAVVPPVETVEPPAQPAEAAEAEADEPDSVASEPPPDEPPPPSARADGEDTPAEPESESGLRVAPVGAGRGSGEAGDGGPPDRKPLVFGGAVVLALVLIALLYVFLAGGDAEEEAGRGILSPSVDCSDTGLASHAIICGSEALSARETELSDRYEAALAAAEGRDRIALQQGYAAYQARRDECRTAACIAAVYDAREGELAEYDIPVEQGPPVPPDEEGPAQPEPEAREADRPVETAPPARAPVEERPRQTTEERPTQPETRPAPQPDPPRRAETTPPQPIGNPAGWVRAADYPANILRNGEEGTSRYQVRVGANGIPTACFTIGSSGHFQLDARACNMVMSRARFQPARNAAGNPVPGLYTGSHRWRAPR
ncbi:TonB family protein [Parasphingopyxis algicola]|uniref:TonB family protein n=1 Tax=Parasphingopyxis algicola TaxID=2026624 RepID=UPI0015A07E32|nr:TonB family protein [Parasphingopyxis algicola]QLC26542.1 TonB family protein [Parasphingopyxis algicola]